MPEHAQSCGSEDANLVTGRFIHDAGYASPRFSGRAPVRQDKQLDDILSGNVRPG